jgi:hypothetical protein
MTTAENTTYLNDILTDQTLAAGSSELMALRQRRNGVEDLLRATFGYEPRIRYGGSYTKGTMIKHSYDLDITSYFPNDSGCAGATLKTIYESVEEVLREDYWTEPKGSAIRLRSRDDQQSDFHIDVVPGRFVEGKEGDVHLHRSTGEKAFLKTNLEKHVEHIQGSKVIPAIRLMKLWSRLRNVQIKTFALELLIIKLLDDHKSASLPDQLEHILGELCDDSSNFAIEDPANPYGNDISDMLNPVVRLGLKVAATSTLQQIDQSGWDGIFGQVEPKITMGADRMDALRSVATSGPELIKPWAHD